MADVIDWAKGIFDCEIEALQKTRDSIDSNFELIIDKLHDCKGKVVVTGVGKTGHIGQKISATLSSLGTSSIFMNAAEALHGDLGIVEKDDIVILISKSGESDEIKTILPNIKMIGATMIAITNCKDSQLAQNSDIVFVFPEFDEACHLKIAPTSSATTALVLGDAIAVVLSKLSGFSEENFGLFHPGGLLGKRLIVKTKDLTVPLERSAVLSAEARYVDVISAMCKYPSGIAVLIHDDRSVAGVISDGDIRRQINKRVDVYNIFANEVMTKTPLCIEADTMAVRALELLRNIGTHAAPVIENGVCIGVITANIITGEGITR